MQFLQGKSIQHEFCHLINMLLDSAKQVVVAADRPPSELESLEPRVRSRLNGGVALEMAAPDYEMRLSCCKPRLAAAAAEDPSIDIADGILDHVARTVTGSGRELEGAFNQLLFRQSFEPQTVGRPDRRDCSATCIARASPSGCASRTSSASWRATTTCRRRSSCPTGARAPSSSRARSRCIWPRCMTPRSLPEIGRRFGGRDHTTVLHAVRKIEDLSGSDKKMAQETRTPASG